MEVAFSRSILFKNFIKSFSGVVAEFLWICNQEGIQYTGMDRAQVVLVAFKLRRDVFLRYIFQPGASGTEISIGLAQPVLSQLLRIMPDNAPLVVQDCRDQLKISSSDEGVFYQSRVSTIDLNREYLDLPSDALYKVQIRFPCSDLQSLIKDLGNIQAENVTVRVIPGSANTKQGHAIAKTEYGDADESLSLFADTYANKGCSSSSTVQPQIVLEGTSSIGTVSTKFTSGVDGFGAWDPTAKLEQSFPLKFLREHALKFCSLTEFAIMYLGGGTVPLQLRFYLMKIVEPEGADENKVFDDQSAPQHPSDRSTAYSGSNRCTGGEDRSFVAVCLSALRATAAKDDQEDDRASWNVDSSHDSTLPATQLLVDDVDMF